MMDLSIGTYVPWVGLIIGTALSVITIAVAVGAALRKTRDNDSAYSDVGAPYVIAVILVAVAMGAAVGIDMYAWHSEGDGDVGTLRSEADRVYGISLSTTEANALKDGEVLVVQREGDEQVVIRLEGDKLVTVGDWVPLER